MCKNGTLQETFVAVRYVLPGHVAESRPQSRKWPKSVDRWCKTPEAEMCKADSLQVTFDPKMARIGPNPKMAQIGRFSK